MRPSLMFHQLPRRSVHLSSRRFSQISHSEFLEKHAVIQPPPELSALLEVLQLRGETIVSPAKRSNLNPFLIPLAQSSSDNSFLCYLRWPTQRAEMDLQLVRTTEAGVKLVSLSTAKYCLRELAELDFQSHRAFDAAHAVCEKAGVKYASKDFNSLINSGKFASETEWDRRLILDRYLLTKVGAFPDCYERLAENFLKNNNDISALVTSERSNSLFNSWGHPLYFHCKMLQRLKRDKEVKESATAAMNLPKWTIANNQEELEEAVKMAGYSSIKILGDMHKFRSSDPRTKDLEEKGLDPKQIPLDQAAHLMDAITLGSVEGGWDGSRALLAEKYRLGGYPEMADFVEYADQ